MLAINKLSVKESKNELDMMMVNEVVQRIDDEASSSIFNVGRRVFC